MNSNNVTERLNAVRELLHQLGEGVVELANTHPDVFDDPQLKKEVEEFQEAYQEAKRRLDNPKLSIATLGTTSSGKSTIVNALIGRRIAPIERSEMSGGILKFGDSDTVELLIENTENAKWETGKWTDLTDDELYHRIQQVMWSYHETRKQRTDCLAPQITVQSQLLPVRDRALLNLPEGIDLEIIDLPGLKSVQDRANLQVIQPQVRKSCSLVALDYGQVDEEHRQRLLQELKEVVEYLNGRTDSMIFVLNRVDMRGADDFPLDQQIERLKAEIQSVLSLDTPPDVIPFSARLLYYAQCAWGVEGGHLASKIDQQTRLKLLQAMFADCAGMIRQSTAGDKNLRRWFRDIEDEVEDGETIDDETMHKILRYAQEWSGGQQLWNTLRYRVQESFPELVIAPALNPVFYAFNSLSTKIETIAEIRKIQDLKEIEELRKKLEKTRQQAKKNIKKLSDSFKGEILDIKNELIENTVELKENTVESRTRVQQKLQERGITGFDSFTDAVDAVKQDIILKLIRPVRKTLQEQDSAYELEDQLQEVVSPVIARKIAKAYDSMRTKLNNEFKDSDGYLIKSVRKDDEKAIQKLDHAEKSVRTFFAVMREGILARAEFTLQTQAQNFEEALQLFTESKVNSLLNAIRDDLPNPQLYQAIFSDFVKDISLRTKKIPESILNFSELIEAAEEERRIKTEKRTIKENYTEGSCFFKEEKTRDKVIDVYGEVKFKELKLPNPETMAKQWTQGIEKAESPLWSELTQWIIDYLELIGSELNESVEQVLELANRSLDEQESFIEQLTEETNQRWNSLQEKKGALDSISQQLNALSIGD